MRSNKNMGLYQSRLKISHVLAALVFAFIYVNIPWESLYSMPFKDKQNYYDYLAYGQSVLSYLTFDRMLDYLLGEWLWHYILDNLIRNEFLTAESFFNFISFSLVFAYSLIVLSKANPIYLLFLFNPLVVDFGFTQLRHSLSMVLIVAALFIRSRSIRIAVLALSALIHTSAILFIGLYFFSTWSVSNYLKNGKLHALRNKIIIASACISLAIGPALSVVLAWLGDRRSGDKDLSSSVFYLSFWIIVSFLFMLNLKRIQLNVFAILSLILLLTVAMTVITKGYSLRLLSVLFPFFIVLTANSAPRIRIPVVGVFLFYSIVQWMYWFRII